MNCKNLTSINLPSSMESIGSSAFQGCKSLTNVTFAQDSNLTKIGDGSFNNIPNLKSIDIPEGVTIIGHNAFNLSGINNLVLPDSVFSIDDVPADDESGYFHGLSFYGLSDIENVYCSEASLSKCQEYFNNENVKFWQSGVYYPISEKSTYTAYSSDGERYYANGKWYESLSNINKGDYTKKRIYSVQEATKVVGKKNTFKIRYR